MKIKFRLTKEEKEFIQKILPIPSDEFERQSHDLSTEEMILDADEFDAFITELAMIYKQFKPGAFGKNALAILDKVDADKKIVLENSSMEYK